MRAAFAILAAAAFAFSPSALTAQSHGHPAASSPYAGQQDRQIKSLSEDDISELRRGGGWGLALPAELNGKPGPAHLLELRDAIGLSKNQVAAIEEIYADMRAEAIAAGERFIAAEAALSTAFAAGGLDVAELRKLVRAAEAARSELRYVHLSRHLATPPLLSDQQLGRYNILRGYASDPCANTPDGHDARMWRKHNNCG